MRIRYLSGIFIHISNFPSEYDIKRNRYKVTHANEISGKWETREVYETVFLSLCVFFIPPLPFKDDINTSLGTRMSLQRYSKYHMPQRRP